MSLRAVMTAIFVVMALTFGLLYVTWIKNPPHTRPPTMAETRAINRTCQARCAENADADAKRARNSEELLQMGKACVDDCIERLMHLRRAKREDLLQDAGQAG